MDFFKKREKEAGNERKELPELPGMSSTPMLPELPPLPSLPRTRAGDAMNLSAIKGSVSREEPMMPRARAMELPEDEMPASPRMQMPRAKEPVFVRIDKFRDAVKKFEDVKQKVGEIDDALKKIRGIKDEEESELRSWEQDVQAIKEKVRSVENSLFTKL